MAADQLGFLHITIIIKRITMKLETTAIRAARAIVAHAAKLSFHLGKRNVQLTEDRPFLANFSRAKLSCLSALTILTLVPAASARAGDSTRDDRRDVSVGLLRKSGKRSLYTWGLCGTD